MSDTLWDVALVLFIFTVWFNPATWLISPKLALIWRKDPFFYLIGIGVQITLLFVSLTITRATWDELLTILLCVYSYAYSRHWLHPIWTPWGYPELDQTGKKKRQPKTVQDLYSSLEDNLPLFIDGVLIDTDNDGIADHIATHDGEAYPLIHTGNGQH